ncbi:LysE family translocator [Corynebacterium testudinoris]|nr:LysE family translocator [Corynebacterium testudinoris]
MEENVFMLPLAAILGFGLAITPLVLTPGASFALVSTRGLAGDRRGAWATIVGTAAGILTHAVLAGFGLAALVMRSAELYHVVRLAGAVYLVGLGMYLIWQGYRRQPKTSRNEQTDSAGHQCRRLWQAYVANVLNVKAASVYLTLAPQFVNTEGVSVSAMLTLAGVHIVVMTVWLGAWSFGLTSLAVRFDPRRWIRVINAAGGVALIALGVRSFRPAD